MIPEPSQQSWYFSTLPNLVAVVVSSVCVYIALVLLVRLAGLRSFSKMSSFDFAVTVAMGSLLASALLTQDPPLLQAIVGLACLFGLQVSVGWARHRWRWMERLVDNQPTLLVFEQQISRANLARTRVTEDDLWAKMREANVLDPSRVHAIVLETTGDLTILHGDSQSTLHPDLLTGVELPVEGDLSDWSPAERVSNLPAKGSVRDSR